MKNLVTHLNKQVANFGVLYTKLHNFHWFAYGKQFIRLHELFEEFYDEITEHFDAVAERVLMLGERPVASLKEFLEITSIEEVTNQLTNEEMLQITVDDFKKVDAELKDAITAAQDLEDEVTVDLLIGISASLQKHVWFLEAMLK